jgi:hypothetical protein
MGSVLAYLGWATTPTTKLNEAAMRDLLYGDHAGVESLGYEPIEIAEAGLYRSKAAAMRFNPIAASLRGVF